MSHDIDQYWQKIKNGDERALEIVFKEIYSPLCYYSGQLTGDTFLSQEIVQDVLLKIWQNRTVLIVKGSFRAYLFKSVHNHSLNAIRQQKTKKHSVNLPGSEEIWQFVTDNYDVDDNLIEKIFSDETEKLIHQVIEKLSGQCGRIFRMSRFESLTNEEIARKLYISENTVKTHIYIALQKITYILKENK
jgi:RNA polymerase sigma-70 factor (ECF subfamily)